MVMALHILVGNQNVIAWLVLSSSWARPTHYYLESSGSMMDMKPTLKQIVHQWGMIRITHLLHMWLIYKVEGA